MGNGSTETLTRRLEHEIATHSQELSDRFRRVFAASRGKAKGTGEIVLLNRFWHVQLGYLNINTINERSWLVSDVDEDTWFEYFKSNVLPVVIRENLPVPMSQLQ